MWAYWPTFKAHASKTSRPCSKVIKWLVKTKWHALDVTWRLNKCENRKNNSGPSNVEGSQGQVGQYAAGDIAELDRIFGPTGYESDLGNIRRTRQAAMANLNDTLLGDLKRALSLNSRGGTAGTGLGSYLSRQAASEAGKIRAQAAVDDATQARADLAALMSARTGSIGRRQSVTDALLSRLLAPADKEMGAQSGLNAQLQAALNAALANLVSAYGMKAY